MNGDDDENSPALTSHIFLPVQCRLVLGRQFISVLSILSIRVVVPLPGKVFFLILLILKMDLIKNSPLVPLYQSMFT